MRRIAVLFVLLLPGTAAADWRDWRWAFDVDLAAQVERAADDDVYRGSGTIAARALGGKSLLGLAAGTDVQLGFEVPGSFVYGFHLSPVGLSLRLGDRAYLGLTGGIGLGGATGRVPLACELPVDAFLAFDLGRWVRVVARGRATYTPWSDRRQDGAPTLDFADEAEASLALAFGRRNDEWGMLWSDGTAVAFVVREQLGERFFGLVLAIDMNGSSGR